MERPFKIDLHTHILPREWPDLEARYGYGGFVRLEHHAPGCARMLRDGKFFREIEANCWDPPQRLSECAQHGVDVQVLSTVPVMFGYHARPEHGLDLARLLNDHLAGVVAAHPARFMGLGTLPMQAPELAVRELERCVNELGLPGVQIGSNVNGRNLDDPALEPVWIAANRLKAFVLIHPNGEIMPGDRLKSYYMRNFVGLPFETTMAGAALVFGGVIERFPDIAFCLCHGGGFLPYQAGRFLHAFKVREEPKARLRGSPEDSLRKLYVDSIVHSPRALDFLIDTMGEDHVLLGSDYPFDMGNLDCVARVEALARPEEVRDKVLGGSAARLLGVEMGSR